MKRMLLALPFLAACTTTTLLPVQPEPSDLDSECKGVQWLQKFPPRYPPSAAKAGQNGWVKAAFRLSPDGTLVDVKVLSSSPEKIFGKSVVDVLGKWRHKDSQVDSTKTCTIVMSMKINTIE